MIYTFFSSAGGVGKSTLCVHLAYAAALMGKRTLLIDLSPMSASLDLLCGCSESVVYTFADVADGRISPEKAWTEVLLTRTALKQNAPFLFVPTLAGEEIKQENASSAVLALAKASGADIVFIDADLSFYAALFPISSGRILLTDARESSLRSSEVLSLRQSEREMPFSAFMLCKESLVFETISKEPLVDIIDRLALPPLGIIPSSTLTESFSLCVHKRYKKEPYFVAVQNTVARLLGQSVPLLSGIQTEGISRRRYLERARAK